MESKIFSKRKQDFQQKENKKGMHSKERMPVFMLIGKAMRTVAGV